MKKYVKAILAGSAIGASIASVCGVHRMIKEDCFSVDPDILFTDEEISEIEKQARHCHCRADNVCEADKKDARKESDEHKNSIVFEFDGENYLDSDGKTVTEDKVIETIKNEKSVTVDYDSALSGMSMEEIEKVFSILDTLETDKFNNEDFLLLCRKLTTKHKKG